MLSSIIKKGSSPYRHGYRDGVILFLGVRGCWLFGWGGGSQLYIVALIPLIAASEKISSRIKILFCISFLFLYIVLWFFASYKVSFYPLPVPWDHLLRELNLFIVFGVVTFSYYIYTRSFTESERVLVNSNSEINTIANTDPLTGTYNRRFMELRLDEIFQNLKGTGNRTIITMVDLDNFKSINDSFGHESGDIVLKEVVKIMRENLRENDIIGRWGGEEFLIILNDNDPATGVEILDRLRLKISQKKIPLYNHPEISVSATMGVAVGDASSSSWRKVVVEADAYLYQGKTSGKNQIRSAPLRLRSGTEEEYKKLYSPPLMERGLRG